MIRTYKGITPQVPETAYVDDSAQLLGDVIIGEHSSVWMNAVLRGDVHQIRVGHYSNIQDNSVLHGMKEQYGVNVGDYVTVGHNVILHGCTVEARCLIGMGSIILNGVVIGSGLDHRRRHSYPRKNRRRAKLSMDGLSWKIPPSPRKGRREHDSPLR